MYFMSYEKYDVDMSENLTPEQVKAARALLAWSQQELAAAARVAVSTVADFERSFRTPVVNNAQAIRDALEARGLQFVAGGVVQLAMLPPPAPSPKPGTLMRWITSTHLSQWGARRDAQSALPELISRLIYATTVPAAYVYFPSDESIQQVGWDGISRIGKSVGEIPGGTSGWELGVQRNGIRGKADDDYKKRSADSVGLDQKTTTFVFVTPQRFPNKEVWENEKRAEGIWRDIRVIDGNSLVHWLENCPAVAQWLAEKMGRRPRGLRGIQEVWDEWSLATKTALTQEIILTDRDNESTAILKWLKGAPASFAVQAEAPDEAIAFLHASIARLPKNYQLAYESRCVVANDAETARDLVGLGAPLIIVAVSVDAGLVQRLVEDGHHVFSVHGEDVGVLAPALKLGRPWRFNLQMALLGAGLSEEEAHRYSRASGRSLAVLRRLMPATPNKVPDWAKSSPGLNAAMLAGAWNELCVEDCKIISFLAGKPYEVVEAELSSLATIKGGPIRRVGSIWKLTSLRDAWTLLAPSVSKSQFERFETAFQKVLSKRNPRFAADKEEFWIEREGEFGDENSASLRQGMAETMIALGVFPEAAKALSSGSQRADRAVRKLLGSADAHLWWSLRGEFFDLAEASPVAFLESVETALAGEAPPIMSLFRSDEGFLTRREYLSDLLWALEMLGRSPDYHPRAAVLLAHLDEVDPGGKQGNRPAASLRRIFVTWTPQTYASPEQRLKAIDLIVKRFPKVGWRLLVALAPRHYDTSEPSPHPNWRDFTPDEKENITWGVVARATEQIGERLLSQVGCIGVRWESLLDLWANFDQAWRVKAARKLSEYARGLSNSADIECLRDKIRDIIQKHRNFSDADWAIPEGQLKSLDEIFGMLQPAGPEERHRWLFRPNPNFFRPNVAWEDLQTEHVATQRVAAEELLTVLSPARFLDFGETVTLNHALGFSIANADVSEEIKTEVIVAALRDNRDSSADISMGVLTGLANRNGVSWLDALWERAKLEQWGEEPELRIVRALPIGVRTWDRVRARSESLDRAYWKSMPIYTIPSEADFDWTATKLIDVGRPRDAMSWLGHNIARKPSGKLLARVLRAAVGSETKDSSDVTMFSHYLGLILDYLETDASIDEDEIVQLEWIYFQALRYSQRRPKTLHRALAKSPEFFAQLIRLIYVPDKNSGVEEPPPDSLAQAQNLARQAFDVMHDWSHVPGADDHGVIDGAALEDWVKKARKLCAESGRGEIADQKIGEILAAAQREPDELWPPKPVREVIEAVRSRHLEQGVALGVINRRGVTMRSPLDGGEQERELADRYQRDADALRFDWLRTAAVLERISENYASDAKREDIGAEQRDWQ
jgi:DNA-binding transcriptional regulator YiaG